MSEPMPTSDALSGVDGTQLPEPMPTLPDPLVGPGRDTWWDAPELPPFVLPPIPDASVIREAIAAALGEDFAEAVDQDSVSVPAPGPAATQQEAGPPNAPTGNVPHANVPHADVGVTPPSTAAAGSSAGGPPTGGPPTTDGGDRSPPRQPPVAVPIPATPSQPRRTARPRNHPPREGASRKPLSPADFRRFIRREGAGSPLRTRFDGGATAFFIVMLIIVGLLVYNIITGFLQSISSFFQ